MRTACRALLISVLACGSIAGCGHQPQAATFPAPDRLDEATIDMITNTGDYSQRRYRVDEIDVSLTRQCMRNAGFAWAGVADKPNPDANDGRAASLDYIRRHGYGLSEKPPAGGAAMPGPVADDTGLRTVLLGPADDLAELTAPNGVVYTFPHQGCAARSHIAVYGDLDTWARIFYLPQEINLALHGQATADPRYAAKLQGWRDCMARKNYSYESPNDAVERLTEQYRSDTRSLEQRRAAEIKIAMQDALCDEQVRLSATALALRREYAQRLQPSDRAEMARLSALFDEAELRSQNL